MNMMKKIVILLLASSYTHTQPLQISLDYDTYVIPAQSHIQQYFFRDFTQLETERFILRKIKITDTDDIFALVSDPEVTKHTAALEQAQSTDDACMIIDIMMRRYEANLPTRWVIVDKINNRVIGLCGFVAYSPAFARGELGYALMREYWGKGVATETAQAVIEFGFTTMGLNRIEATCDPMNIGSARVLEKLGMKFEGLLREHIWSKNGFRDRKMYSLLKNEWASLQEACCM